MYGENERKFPKNKGGLTPNYTENRAKTPNDIPSLTPIGWSQNKTGPSLSLDSAPSASSTESSPPTQVFFCQRGAATLEQLGYSMAC